MDDFGGAEECDIFKGLQSLTGLQWGSSGSGGHWFACGMELDDEPRVSNLLQHSSSLTSLKRSVACFAKITVRVGYISVEIYTFAGGGGWGVSTQYVHPARVSYRNRRTGTPLPPAKLWSSQTLTFLPLSAQP